MKAYHPIARRRRALSLASGVSGACLCAALAAPMLTPGSALAAAAAAPDQSRLAEVIVTAEKTEQNLQKAPVAVTALSSAALASRGVSDPADLQSLVPSVEFQPIFNLLVTIRGIGNFDLQPGVDAAVAYSIDGTYISHQYALPPLLFDLDRVEVLRGPQGTLYGHNSNGGAINLVTSKPVHDFQTKVSVEGGNHALFATQGMVNAPLGDKAALRVSFATSRHDGYLDNGYMDGNNVAARVKLLVEPTTNTNIILSYDFSDKNEKGGTATVCPPGSAPAFATCNGVAWRPFAGLAGQGTDPTTNLPVPNYYKARNQGFIGEMNWRLGFATLTYLPTYRYVDYSNVQTYSPYFGYNPSSKNKLFTQELRLTSDSSSRVKWVAGLYYSNENSRDHVGVLSEAAPNVNYVSNAFDLFKYNSKSFSAFGQVTVPVTDRFRLTGGLRYSDDRKSTVGQAAAYCQNPAGGPIDPSCPSTFPQTPALQTAPTGAKQSHTGVTWKAGAEFDVAAHSLLYFTASTGFKAGGVNQVPVGLSVPATYAPEDITAYELGTKNRFLDGRLQINAEGFYYDYRGYQTLGTTVLPGNILSFLTLNSQKATFYGGELESSFLLTDHDRLDGSVSLLHARYDEFVIPSQGLNLSGYTVSNSPKATVTLGYQHTFDLPNGGAVIGHVETHITTAQWVDLYHSPGSRQEAYTRTEADLTYQAPDGHWTVTGWMRNIENYGAFSTYYSTVALQPVAIVLPPRTFGVRIQARY